MRIYSNPERENETYALPDIEIFYVSAEDFVQADPGTWQHERVCELDPSPFSNLTDCSPLAGWYYWSCFPGCLPDADPVGPFTTLDKAAAGAREED